VPERKRRSWDVALTAALLFLAVYDVVGGFAGFAQLGAVLSDAFEQQGIDEFSSFKLAANMGVVINIARIAILAIVIVVSLVLMSRNRLTFWVPIAGGVLAGLVVLVCILVVILADPALLEYVNSQQL
jgi:flagellar biosynthesis protein FlhB